MFQGVRQCCQPDISAVFPGQSLLKEIITYFRIFRKKGAVEIGADDIFVGYSFIAGFSGISQAEKNFPKGGVISDIGSPTVIFKSYNRIEDERIFKDNILYQALF